MNKSLEALLRGYFLFEVNGRFFFTYNAAQKQREQFTGPVWFNGLHVFKGWQCFFLRVTA